MSESEPEEVPVEPPTQEVDPHFEDTQREDYGQIDDDLGDGGRVGRRRRRRD